MSKSTRTVVIVGAGPYGLSVAAHLRHQGVHATVFGTAMATWTDHMPAGMFLKSTSGASSLSAPTPGYELASFLAHRGMPPLDENTPLPVELFVRYGRWFQEELVPELQPEQVKMVAAAGDGYRVSLGAGDELDAVAVVVAAGVVPFAYVPEVFSPLTRYGLSPSGPISHASDHGDLARLADRRVAVIGGGQSALESAVLLREAGAQVHLVVRKPHLVWGCPPPEATSLMRRLAQPGSPLGPGWSHRSVSGGAGAVRHLPEKARLNLVRRILGPSGAWWLHDRFTEDIIVHLEHQVDGMVLARDEIALSLRKLDGSRSWLGVDHVLAATGYRIDVDSFGFLDSDLRSSLRRTGSAPRLGKSFESSLPGLYFVGLAAAPTFGPLLRFVAGAGFAARRASTSIASRTS